MGAGQSGQQMMEHVGWQLRAAAALLCKLQEIEIVLDDHEQTFRRPDTTG
jgi:hypothetical protein